MNIARPLDLDPADDLARLPHDVFGLPPRDFVEAWARALGLSEEDVPASDRESLAAAIGRGGNRLKVIEGLRSRKAVPIGRGVSLRHDVRRPPDRLVLLDVLVRFAPDDDAAFLRYAFGRICEREPSPAERLELEFDLRGGRGDRAATIRRIAGIARREGHLALWDTLGEDEPSRDPGDARLVPAGFALDEAGRETCVLCRAMPDGAGWWVGPDMLRQTPRMTEGGWSVGEGWLLAGPKRSLAPGSWRLDVDLVQAAETRLAFDVVANCGLDVLQRLHVAGPFCGGIVIEIEPDHRFLEVRLEVPRGQGPTWIKPRDISLRRLP